MCVCVSLVCGKKRRRWRRKTVNVTRWHFWNNKVTACRWQLSLVLSLSDLCGTIAPFFHIAQRNDVEKKRRKRSPPSFLLLLSFLPPCSCLHVYGPFFSVSFLWTKRNEQRWSTNERMNADIYSAIEGCST